MTTLSSIAEAPVFTLENISFGYTQERTLLRDINFSLAPGCKVGLLGPNGCGKTTLFQVIVGLLRPQQGRVLLQGAAVEKAQDWRRMRCKVGLVLQHAEDQLFCPTVMDDVAFGPLNLGLTPAEAGARALETLESLGLTELSHCLTHRLSGGEKKLVSLAAVMAMRPDALLLDEPTNGLDPDARQRLIEVLTALPTARITISHDWDFLAATSTTLMTLSEGQLSAVPMQALHTHKHVHLQGHVPHEH